MRDSQAIIERIRRTSATVQRLDVAVDSSQRSVQPGQHFLAHLTEGWDPYLREPWTPIRQQGNTLVIERPAAYVYEPGQVVNLLGPIGKPISLSDVARTLLLIAYDSTPASLLLFAETALQRRIAVTLVLVGAARQYALEALPEQIEVLHGDDNGNWPDQRNVLKWADQIVAVAPPPHEARRYGVLLETARQARVELPPGYLSGLFQPPLPCGVGACQACLIRRTGGEALACIEGPAFDLLSVTLG